MEYKVLKPVANLVILGALIACTEKQMVVDPLAIPPVRMTVLPPSVSNAPLMVPEFNPGIIVNLPTYADPVIAEFRLDGTVFAKATPGTEKHNHVIDGAGIWIESFTGCYVNVVVTYTQGIWGPGPCSRPLQDPSIDTTLVQGQGTIKRVTGIPQWDYECNYGPCYTYEGAQSYSITPLSAALDLTTPGTAEVAPGQIDVPPGTWVVFQVAPSPLRIKNIDVPLRVVSWQWTASTGGAGQTVLTGGATAIQRSVYIAEPGSMVVTAIVNGAERVDTVTNGRAGQVKIVPEKPSMLFTAILEAPYLPRHDTSTQMITVSVADAGGVPIPSQSVTLVQAATENTAGHHHTGGKPVGLLDLAPSVTVNTGASGTTTVQFRAPEVSGPITITGTSPGATSGNARIDVGLFTLQEFLPGTGYTLIGGETHGGVHFENHFATQSHIADLQALAARYYAKFSTGLEYNDSSLPLGGLFDFAWDEGTPWRTPHGGHRDGVNTDLRIIAVGSVPALTQDQQSEVRRLWQRRGGQIFPEGTPKHWHLRYPKKQGS